MKLIQAYVQPHKLSDVTMAIHRIPDITGVTVQDVRGWGRGHHQEEGTSEPSVGEFEKHVKIEVVCGDALAGDVVDMILGTAHTGLRGDGVILVMPIEEVVRISTGARGDGAL